MSSIYSPYFYNWQIFAMKQLLPYETLTTQLRTGSVETMLFMAEAEKGESCSIMFRSMEGLFHYFMIISLNLFFLCYLMHFSMFYVLQNVSEYFSCILSVGFCFIDALSYPCSTMGVLYGTCLLHRGLAWLKWWPIDISIISIFCNGGPFIICTLS